MSTHPTLPMVTAAFRASAVRGLPREPVLYAAWSVVLIAAYFAIDAASFMFWIDPIPVKPWNPQAGLAVAFVYAGGARYAWPLLVAATTTEALLHGGGPWFDQLIAAAAITVPLTLTGVALRNRRTLRDLAGVPAIRDFLLIAAAGAALSAALSVLAYLVTHQQDLASLYSSMLHKWLGDITGIVIVAPLTMLMIAPNSLALRPAHSLWLDLGVLAGTLLTIVLLVFSGTSEAGEGPFYLLFVPLIVLAMRRGLPGAILGSATVQVAILFALWLAGRSVEEASAYQLLVLVLAVTTLLLGAVSGERGHALAELARRSAELRAQQHALSDAMRFSAASETAATLAHELSQPLSAIGTYARAGLEMLRRGRGNDIQGVMERIVAESSRTRESVQRIRDFFRTGAVRREPTSLAAVVDDAADAVRDRLRSRSIALTVDVPASLPAVSADPIQVRTVLHNLIGNAADAVSETSAPRWIRIAARERDANVEVDIADSGSGIDPSLSHVLFEPLVTTKPAGMGLGLSISRTLVQAHGGRLDLAATHPTTFRFTLPIHGNHD
ncbi:MAG TPA: ATP-binding protein [Casimicrobiaceae bacterium]|nr:ATP-binding protein [Casimicrobiaceae bacterium]